MEDANCSAVFSAETKCRSRLGLCNVCGACESKYNCPRCEAKTCCLVCVKKHKSDRDCSGQRDITAFRNVSDFTNLDLLSDYRFLEETARSVERAQRDPLKFGPRFRKLPIRLSKLRQAAAERCTRLLFLPDRFLRHSQNTTYFDWKLNLIKWKVEWHFPQADNATYVDDLLLEDERLCSLLAKYLEPEAHGPVVTERLQFYQATGLLGVHLLLKAESVERAGTRFHFINASDKLKTVLKGKTVVEFPVIYVVLQEHTHLYELVPPGERREVVHRVKHGNKKIKLTSKVPLRRDGRKQKRTKTKRSLQNLLFSHCDSPKGTDTPGEVM